MFFIYILLALGVLMVFITVHELGHYIAGKILKFKINEFAIGFGPAIFSKKNKKTGEKFSIRAIPLGGYCAFEGEDASGSGKIVANKDDFNKQAPWKRLIVLFCGALFNIIFGLFTVIVMLMTIGFDAQKVSNSDDVSYAASEMQTIDAGDIIYKIDGKHVSMLKGGVAYRISGKEVGDIVLVYIKGKPEPIKVLVQTLTDKDGNGHMGIGVAAPYYKYNFFEAIGNSFRVTYEIAAESLIAIFKLFTFQMSLKNVSGPIGTIGIIAGASQINLMYLLLLFPLISINVGVFNLIPFPALDGSKMIFVGVEWVRGKPINRNVEAIIHTVGLFALLAFVLIIDLVKLF